MCSRYERDKAVGCVAGMREIRIAYKIVFESPEFKVTFGIIKCRRQILIKLNLKIM